MNCKTITISKNLPVNSEIKKISISYTNVNWTHSDPVYNSGGFLQYDLHGTATLDGQNVDLIASLSADASGVDRVAQEGNVATSVGIHSRDGYKTPLNLKFRDVTNNRDVTGTIEWTTSDLDNVGGDFTSNWEGFGPSTNTSFVRAEYDSRDNSPRDPQNKFYREHNDTDGHWYSGYQSTSTGSGYSGDLITWRTNLVSGWTNLGSYIFHWPNSNKFFDFDFRNVTFSNVVEKVTECEEEIQVISYLSSCEGGNCTFKENDKTFIKRKAYEKNDGTYLYSNWYFEKPRLNLMSKDMQFDGKNLVNIEVEKPYIVEYVKVNDKLINVFIYKNCDYSKCSFTKDETIKQYKLINPYNSGKTCSTLVHTFMCGDNMLKHYEVTELPKIGSYTCTKDFKIKSNAVYYCYYNKQEIKTLLLKWLKDNSSEIINKLENFTFDKTNCGDKAINGTNKTIIGSINEIKTSLDNKVDKVNGWENFTLDEVNKIKQL